MKVLRVAIVHDWLVTWRGGEKVLESIASLYPDAPIYTLFCDRQVLPETLRHRRIHVHPTANRFSFLRKALLPFLPVWIESFDLGGYDLIISTSSCVAKGIIPHPDARHVCYIHSPMRYVWDQQEQYLSGIFRIPVIGFIARAATTLLRIWDVASSARVDLFVANSTFVKRRVQKYYGRKSVVIPPPVDTGRFIPENPAAKKGYLLAAGAFVGYKRFDLAIAACERLGKKLIVAGHGPLLGVLEKSAGPNTTIFAGPDDETWKRLMREADGFLFPGVEDFGITAIEALASGTPLIAYKAGGALDFVNEGETGVFFEEPTVDSLCEALRKFERLSWNPRALSDFSQKFSRALFEAKIKATIEELTEPEVV